MHCRKCGMEENVTVEYSNETLKKVDELRLIDDAFFRLLAKDKAACQEIINTLTGGSFEVLSVTPQKVETSAFREVVLDVLCRTNDGRLVNIEVQKGNGNNDVKRCRFHASAITANHTDKGTDFEDVPDVIILYITEYDVLGSNQAVTVCETCALTGDEYKPVNDGVKIFYANTEVKEDSKKGELLELFLQNNATSNSKFPNFCERIKYYKEDRKGRLAMCKIIEEYAQDASRKSIISISRKNYLQGLNYEFIIQNIAEELNVSEEEATEIFENEVANDNVLA